MAPTSLSPVVNPLLLEATLGSTTTKGSTEDRIVILVTESFVQYRLTLYSVEFRISESVGNQRLLLAVKDFTLFHVDSNSSLLLT